MKHLLLCLACCLLFKNMYAQVPVSPEDILVKVEYLPETGASFFVTEILLDLPANDSILHMEPGPFELKFSFTGIDPQLFQSEKHKSYALAEGRKLLLIVRSSEKYFASQLARQIQDQAIFLSDEVQLTTNSGKYSLSADSLKAFSRGKLNMAADKEATLYQNYLRFGLSQAGESWGFSVYSEMNKKYPVQWLHGLSYHAEVLIGTQSRSPVHFLKVYPLVVAYRNQSSFLAQFGIESDQSFQNVRLSSNFEVQSVIPYQLVDLRRGYARFRLFPYLSGGANLYHPLKNTPLPGIEGQNEGESTLIALQLYGRLRYYFPVLERLNFLFDASLFYDSNETIRPDQLILYKIQVGSGYGLSDRTKIFMHYINGYNEVSLRKGELILMGIAVDFF